MAIAATLRALGANLLELLRTRLELASIELQEGTQRLFGYLALAAVAAVLGLFALALAVLFVLLLFWDEHRLLAVGGMTVLFALGCALAVGRLRSALAARAPLLGATLAELRKDAASLKGDAFDER
jgi:uncharacterized membrane protein YqjE